MSNLRYCAVPLVTVDPFFSIWSMCDNLYDDVTKHWTGARNPMSAGVYIDGKYYSFMGQQQHNSDRHTMPYEHMKHIDQKSVLVTPTRTYYTFENEVIRAELTFTSPLILKRKDIMCRPVSYIEYKVEVIDGKEHTTEFYFDISTECAIDAPYSTVICKKGKNSVYFGKCHQTPLSKCEDSMTIDWGYIHVSEPDAKVIDGTTKFDNRVGYHDELEFDKEYITFEKYPYIEVRKKELSGVIALGYDDVYSIEYFGKRLEGYYKKYFSDFDEMFLSAIEEYEEVKALCIEYDKEIMAEADAVSNEYKDIVSLAYRQSIAAHKLCMDECGNDILLSKECHSNGCMATLDCTYEGAPIFYKYNPDMIFAALRPIARYAASNEWPFDFIPHDVGRYPLALGQAYGAVDGKQDRNMQMPVEECGNILLCAAAAVKFGAKDLSFLSEYKGVMKMAADYLVKHGYDPESQICTDDFTGPIAHGCNLSLKAILGIASYAWLYNDASYMEIAKKYADKWTVESFNGVSSKLAFDRENSWSLKYNIVWDKLLGFNLFDDEVSQREVRVYGQNMRRFGVPLDMREDYTVIVWLIWSTAMTDDKTYRDKVFKAVYDFINETEDRVPMTDWYCTSVNRRMNFQNRNVVGGLFINIL